MVVASCMSVTGLVTGSMWVANVSLPLYLSSALGLSQSEIGAVFSGVWLSTLPGSKLGGIVADFRPWIHRLISATVFVGAVAGMIFCIWEAQMGKPVSLWAVVSLLVLITNFWMIIQLSTRLFIMKSFDSGQGALNAGVRSGMELGNFCVIQSTLLLFQILPIPVGGGILCAALTGVVVLNSRMHVVIDRECEAASKLPLNEKGEPHVAQI